MKLLAGRDEIISQVIPLERGLYALVNEGGDESNAVSVQLVPVSHRGASPSIRPMTPNRTGVLHRHEFALLNIRSATEIMAAFIGARNAKAATDLRVVSLDRSSRLSVPAGTNPMQVAPNRHLVRLIAIDPGCHLLRFPSMLSTEHTRMCISLLSPGMTLLVSGQDEGTVEMRAGEVATIDAPLGGEVLLTLIAPTFAKADFAGISIQPLARILNLLRSGRRAQKAMHHRSNIDIDGPICGIRIVWKDRPLGLDLAVSVRSYEDEAFGPAVMTSSWARSAHPKGISDVKISLLGVHRSDWSIQCKTSARDGFTKLYSGQSIEVPLRDEHATISSITMISRSGTNDVLSVELN